VERIDPPRKPGDRVELTLRIDVRLRPLIRTDATARIVAEGFVNTRHVEIVPGQPDAPAVADGGQIASERPVDLADVLGRAKTSLDRLDAVARKAEAGLGEINTIAAAIRNGEGSLGKLVRDDEVHDRLLALASHGDETLDALNQNLEALEHTWPISRYFNKRAYFDRERALYQPGSTRVSRSLDVDDLFEPGRSVLTKSGRRRLDEIGRWFKWASKPASEVVIAAFADETLDEQLAEVLTQEQADSVRAYLDKTYGIASAGWFKKRKVAAIGFGSHVPRALADLAGDSPSSSSQAMPNGLGRRVEIIVFTPQT
jgi:phospholipid/cholesterol/gamma-HCH transport system substrate-binding protein